MGCTSFKEYKRSTGSIEARSEIIFDSIKGFYESNEKKLPNRIRELFSCIPSHRKETQKLDLKFVTMSDTNLQAICLILPKFENCVYLNLWKAALGDAGCSKLAGILHSFTSLKFLSLADNKISSVGLLLISHNFHHFSKLENLELFLNPFKSAGGDILAKSLFHLVNLKKLVLDDCELTSKPVKTLLKVFSKLIYIERISLNYNDLHDFSSESFKTLLSPLNSLKMLSIENTGTSESCFNSLHSSFPSILISY
jgi:hypothetical protein